MSKIIWLTSYPKSGSTWVRYLLSNYFFNLERKFDNKIIDKIPRIIYPKEISTKNIENKYDLNHISKFWIPAQKNLKLNYGQVAFIKNHNACFKIGQNEFTNEKLTLAIIHIVRDPRDVLISAAKFWNQNYNFAIQQIFQNKFHLIVKENDKTNVELISTWQLHFQSWRSSLPSIPKILIKYEDLLENTEEIFTNLLVFLSKRFDFNINLDQLRFSIENSNFNKLSEFEKRFGFSEASKNHAFFRKGKAEQWKSELESEQINLINKYCYDDMYNLGYL